MKKTVLLLLVLCLVFCSCAKADVGNTSASKVEGSVAGAGLTLYTPETTGSIDMPEEIDEKYLTPIFNRLNSANYACSLYYCDLETGFAMSYNGERMFAGASLVKAEFIIPIFEMIQSGKTTYETLYTYKASNKRGGTSKIPEDFNFGDKLTLKQIIEYTIIHSDNTGFNMLQEINSISSFMKWAKNKYGARFEYTTCNWLNANGVAVCWKDIYERASNGDEDFQWLISLLLQANANRFVKGGLPKGDDGESLYQVAHKYGMDINASNDAAIVFYKERPYLLIILTDYIGESTQSFMNKLSADVFEMHEYICSFDS